MSDRDDELAKFEAILSGLIGQLEDGKRQALLRKIAHALRTSQAQRIRAQSGPDGDQWPPRRKAKRAERTNRPIRFLYRKPGSSEPRVADLRSWRREGPHIVGFDREAEALRTFLRARIIRHLPPIGTADPGAMQSALRGRKGQIRKSSQAMFVKMRAPRNLKADASPTAAWVEFTSRASRIARIHQYGLRDKVSAKGPEVLYPQRTLLGFSLEDREAMLQAALDHLAT